MSTDATSSSKASAQAAAGTVDIADVSRRLVEEPFNTGSFELLDQFVAADCINHDPGTPAELRNLRAAEQIKRTATMYRAAFPGVRMTVEDVIAAGDKVALRWHGQGTHRGELMGLAPTGARGSVTGIDIFLWKDGKVAESWTEWDNLGLARQLGAAPPEGSFGEKLGMRMQRLMARRMRKKNQGV
jgi:steroid delta-isomerase-like uncharacterized protein